MDDIYRPPPERLTLPRTKKIFGNVGTCTYCTQTRQVIHPPALARLTLTDSRPCDEIRCEGEAAIAMLSE